MRGRARMLSGLLAALAAATLPDNVGQAQTVAPQAIYGESYAVVVGISRYRSSTWTNLTYARKDAEGMAKLLESQGFRVKALYDERATAKAILSALEDDLAPRLRPNDRLLFFFSGHGHTQRLADQDYGYIVPHDAGAGFSSLISMDLLRILSQKLGAAKHQLFVMDACFGGQFAPKAAVAGIPYSHPRYIEEITRRSARQYLTAGGKDQQVLDGGPEGYSYFTGYLIAALRDGLGDLNGDGYITLAELATYLVPRATNEYQTPGTGTLPGHGLGEFVFLTPASATRPVAAPAPASPPPVALGLRGSAKPPPAAEPRGARPRDSSAAPQRGVETAALPPATASAGRDQLERVFTDNQNEVKVALGSFLRARHNIPTLSFGVTTVWSYTIVGQEPRGHVVRVDYELNTSDYGSRLRTDDFVLRADGRLLRVIDQLTAWQ